MAEKKKTAPVSTGPVKPEDKKKALETALAQIEKNFGKGAIMRLGDDIPVNVEAISTGSLSLDLALGIGGVPRGRIVEIYGPESSGKTTLALHILASAQKEGGEVAFIDVEHALEPAYASPSRTPASRRSRSRSSSCAPARSTSWSSTPWRRCCRAASSRVRWASRPSA